MNRTEYDLGKAAEDRKLKEVELVDFGGRSVHRMFWEPRFVSFKAFKFQNVIYRFGFVFNWTVYYQRTDILDLDKAPIVPWEVMPDDIYRLKERHDEVHKVMDDIKRKEASVFKRVEGFEEITEKTKLL